MFTDEPERRFSLALIVTFEEYVRSERLRIICHLCTALETTSDTVTQRLNGNSKQTAVNQSLIADNLSTRD